MIGSRYVLIILLTTIAALKHTTGVNVSMSRTITPAKYEPTRE